MVFLLVQSTRRSDRFRYFAEICWIWGLLSPDPAIQGCPPSHCEKIPFPLSFLTFSPLTFSPLSFMIVLFVKQKNFTQEVDP